MQPHSTRLSIPVFYSLVKHTILTGGVYPPIVSQIPITFKCVSGITAGIGMISNAVCSRVRLSPDRFVPGTRFAPDRLASLWLPPLRMNRRFGDLLQSPRGHPQCEIAGLLKIGRASCRER